MKMFAYKFGPALKQYFIVIIANFTIFHVGLSVAWLSPVMVKLRDQNQTVLVEPLTENEMSWILSSSCLACLVVFTFSGYLTNRLGRKIALILACIPRIIACVLFIFSTSFPMLLLGRAISGYSDYVGISVTAMYSSEIAAKEHRGGLGSVSQILSCLGSMIILAIGPFVSYNFITLILTSITCLTFIPILFLPETPYFLYSKGKLDEAVKTLVFLRGSEALAREELKEYSSNSTVSVDWKMLIKDVVFLKTIGKVSFLAICSQMIGYNAVTFYLQTIFESTNTSVRPEISSLIIGCIQLFACACTILLTDRCGRKPLLVVSLVLMAAGMVGLGTFFKLQVDMKEVVGWLNYLPLVSVMLVILCYNSGIGSLVWILVAELFDGPTRALGVSLAVLVATIFTFLTTRYFPSVLNSMGPAATYWMFGAFCMVTCIFIAGLVPETKGKAFSEIQRDMRKNDSSLDANIPKDKDKVVA